MHVSSPSSRALVVSVVSHGHGLMVQELLLTLAEQCARAVDAGRINQHELRVVGGEDAANRLSRGLRAR